MTILVEPVIFAVRYVAVPSLLVTRMPDDQPIRKLLMLGFAILLPVMLYYRIRSQSSGERLDRMQEGLFLMIGIRLMGFSHIGGMILFVINPELMRWSAFQLPIWARLAGIGIGGAAAGLIIWTFHHLGKNLTDTVVTRIDHTLVLSGPYRFVRHPFYVALLLSIVANALASANWFCFATGACTFVLIAARSGREEANLVARFGVQYQEYMRRTGRFFPKRFPD